MQKRRFLKSLFTIVCIVLIAAMALTMSGCNNEKTDPDTTQGEQTDITVLGKGATQFSFTVTDADGNQTAYEIHTDKKTVGDALLELGLIAGEESSYGLYVKTVTGITVDYDTDGKYWAFYVDGAYATGGVDSTDITEGAAYSFKVE